MGRVRSVLVVEDNPDNSLIMEIALGLTAALACQFVSTGAEAIERVRERDYEIVLLDPGLPDIGDREIMRAIIESDRNERLAHSRWDAEQDAREQRLDSIAEQRRDSAR